MIVGTQGIHRFAKGRSKAHMVVGGLFCMGPAIALIAAIPNSVAAGAGMVITGICASFLMVPSQTLLQEETPPEMLGRVGGSMISVMMGSQVVGLSIAGPLAQLIGIRNVYFASAAVLVLIGLVGHWKLRTHGSPEAAGDAAKSEAAESAGA